MDDPFNMWRNGQYEFGSEILWVVRVIIVHRRHAPPFWIDDPPTVVWSSEPLGFAIAVVVRNMIENFCNNFVNQQLPIGEFPFDTPLRTTMIEHNPPRYRGANEFPGPFVMNEDDGDSE